MLRHVNTMIDKAAVQPFIEEQVGIRCDLGPWREHARLQTVPLGFDFIMQIFAHAPPATMSLTGRVVTGTGPEARPVRRARGPEPSN